MESASASGQYTYSSDSQTGNSSGSADSGSNAPRILYLADRRAGNVFLVECEPRPKATATATAKGKVKGEPQLPDAERRKISETLRRSRALLATGRTQSHSESTAMETAARQSRLIQPGALSAQSAASASAPGTNQRTKNAANHSPTRKSQLKQPTVTAKTQVENDGGEKSAAFSTLGVTLLEPVVHRSAPVSMTAASPAGANSTAVANGNTLELEDRMMQLTKELAVCKSENDSLRRKLERSAEEVQQQKEARSTEQATIRQRHDVQLTELTKEIAELKFAKSELEFTRGKLEDDLAKTKQELQKSKMQSGQNESSCLAQEDELKLLRNRLRLAEERLQQERGEKATVLAESEVRLTSENCSLDASNRELERSLKTERENAQHADERCKALRDQIRKLNQQLATRPIAYELLALSDVDEAEQFRVERNVLESKWSELPDNLKVNCEDVKAILAQFAKDESLPQEKFASDEEWLAEATKCLWYRNQLLVKRVNSASLALQACDLTLEEFPRALTDYDAKKMKHDEIVKDLGERLANVDETRRNMEIMFKCKLNSLKLEKTDLEVQSKQLTDSVESLNMEISELKKIITQLRSEQGAVVKKDEEPSKEDLDQAVEAARLQEELKQLRKSEMEKQQFVTRLRSELVDLQSEFNRVKQDNIALRAQLKDSESANPYAEIGPLEENQTKLTTQVLEEEVSYWKERSKQLARESEQANESSSASQNEQSSETIAYLTAQLEEDRAKLRVSKATVEELLRKNAEVLESEKRMNDCCRELEAQMDTMTSKQTEALEQLQQRLNEQIEALSKAALLSEPEFCQFVRQLAEENLQLTKETFQLRSDNATLSTKCGHLDTDMQELLERNDALTSNHAQLQKTFEQHKLVMEQLENEVKKILDGGAQSQSAALDKVVSVLRERHRMQAEELATVLQRFELLEKDTALFLDRMRQLDSANDAKVKSQLETILKQLEKLSTDRFDLQSKVLDLKQQTMQLQRAAAEQAPVSTSESGLVQRSLESSGLEDESGSEKHKKLNEPATVSKAVVNASTSSDDLIDSRCTSSSTDDLVETRSMSTSTSDTLFQDLVAAAKASDQEDAYDSDDVRGRNGTDEVRKKTVAKVSAGRVQTSNEDELKGKLDEPFRKLAAELETKNALLEQLRAKEEAERDMLDKLGRIPQLEKELALLSDSVQLNESEKARLLASVNQLREELQNSRRDAMEIANRLDTEKQELNSRLTQLQEELQAANQSAEKAKRLLQTELEFKERQADNKQKENLLLQRKLDDSDEQLSKLRDAQDALHADLQRTRNLLDQANLRVRELNVQPPANHASHEPAESTDNDQSETVLILKDKAAELERELRKEKKLHQISKEHCRSVQEENEDLRKALSGKKRLQHDSHESIDFSGKTRHDVVNELIMQSQAHAKKLLQTVNAGMNDSIKLPDGELTVRADVNAAHSPANSNGNAYDNLLQATL